MSRSPHSCWVCFGDNSLPSGSRERAMDSSKRDPLPELLGSKAVCAQGSACRPRPRLRRRWQDRVHEPFALPSLLCGRRRDAFSKNNAVRDRRSGAPSMAVPTRIRSTLELCGTGVLIPAAAITYSSERQQAESTACVGRGCARGDEATT